MHKRLLLLSATAFFLTDSLVSQTTTYDDFSGTSLDRTKWFQVGDTTRVTQSGGFLRIRGRTHRDHIALLALRGLEGDFEIVLDFAGFKPGGVDGGFALFAFDPEGTGSTETDLLIGMGTTRDASGKTVVGFAAEVVKGGKTLAAGLRASTATAGQVRIRRASNTGSVAFRATGLSSFTRLASASNLFSGKYVSFGIEVFADLTDGADVDCDKITTSGKQVAGVSTNGQGCHGLGAIPLGYPRIGNSAFRFLGRGGSAFAKAPFVFAVGLQVVNQSLAAAGAPGCSVYISPIVTLATGTFDSGGETEIPLGVPNNSGLRGFTFRAQFAAATNLNAMRLATSNGVTCQIW